MCTFAAMKRLCVLFLLFVAVLPVPARLMKDFFKEMPDSLLPVLTHANRLDLLDFALSKMESQVENVYGEKTRMTLLTDNCLKLEETDATTVEMLLLPQKNDTLILEVRTFKDPLNLSRMVIRNTAWSELKTADFVKMPVLADFLVLPAGRQEGERLQALEKADVPMLSVLVGEKDCSLHFKMNCDGGFMDVREELKLFMKDEIVYRWNGLRFEPSL